MVHLNRLLEKYKSEHTVMEYLNRRNFKGFFKKGNKTSKANLKIKRIRRGYLE